MDGRGEPKFNQLRNDRRHGEILARMKLPFKPDRAGSKLRPNCLERASRYSWILRHFLSPPRNLRLLFLLYWMTPLITPVTAWLARAGVESRINKTNNNSQVRVTWHKTTKTQAQA
jgi:hypothetical protein